MDTKKARSRIMVINIFDDFEKNYTNLVFAFFLQTVAVRAILSES